MKRVKGACIVLNIVQRKWFSTLCISICNVCL